MEMKHSLKSLLKYFFMLLYFTWELIFGGRKEGNFEIFVAGVKYCILRDWAGILYIVRGWKGDKATQSEPGQSRMSANPPSPTSAFSKQDHYEDTMQWKYVCWGQAAACRAKPRQRTKAKCASHSLTQSSPLLSWPQAEAGTKFRFKRK